MTERQLEVLRAVRVVRAFDKPATTFRVAKAAGFHENTDITCHLEALAALGLLARAAFLGDEPRGYRLTGKGKALLQSLDAIESMAA